MNCWFCSVREAEADHTLLVEMYGDVDAKKTSSQTRVAYNVRHIDVPRCADCHSRHVVALYATILSVIMTVALIVAVLFAFYAWLPEWAWALWAGVAFGLVLGSLAIRFLILKGIRSIRQAKADYPDIKELLGNGYRFGRRPRGQLPDNDQPSEDKGPDSHSEPNP